MKASALIVLLIASIASATVIPADNVVSLDGKWRFKLEQAKGEPNFEKGERGKIPIDYPEKFEPFFAPDYKEDDVWHDLAVPGNWEMAGDSPATYNQPDNASGFYRLTFDVPATWEGQLVKLNFDGVQNGAEIWCNGQPVKVDEPSWGRENYHEGGWTPFQVDLTSAVKFGQKNLLALRVTKNTKSVDLDTGDYFFLGGIHRTVTLFAVPQAHIDDLTVRTKASGEVMVIAKVVGETKGMKLHTAIADEMEETDAGETVTLTHNVDNPKLWSAEHPNLYDLTVTLKDPAGKPIETVKRRIGIREITINDGVLLLNGVPIKLAGVCRHDCFADTGTAVTPAQWRKDIELMKSFNINAIRTSHYPYGSGFYDLCDELGMYVADEFPYCWTPTDNPDMAPAFLQRARETIRRDKNHPAVLIWAVGNENKEGRNLKSVADLTKELDPTRPRLVSWFPYDKYDTELSDSHYTTSEEIAKRVKKEKNNGHPHIYLENPNDWDVRLAADPGCWEAWWPVLKRPWDIISREPTLPGQFIWEWQDRAVVDKNSTKLYQFDEATGINYLKIKGMVDAFRNPRPWTNTVKNIYSPIVVTSKELKDNSFEVENRYSFTNLSDLNVKWTVLAGDKELSTGTTKADIAPRSKGSIEIDYPDALNATALRIDFDTKDGRNVISHQFTLKEPPAPSMGDWPQSVALPTFNLITRDTKSDPRTWRKITRYTATANNNGEITMDNAPDKIVGKVTSDREGNRFTYRLEWTGEKAEIQELGWVFTMPKEFNRFSWHRQAKWTVYPKDHIARPAGTARPDSMNCSLTKFDRPDAFDFNSTKANCDWASLTNESGAGLMVKFDPNHRHHCRAGLAPTASGGGYTLTVNNHVNPPMDLSTPGVLDLYLTLKPGDVIEGAFEVGSASR